MFLYLMESNGNLISFGKYTRFAMGIFISNYGIQVFIFY